MGSSPLEPGEHLVILVAVAILVVRWLRGRPAAVAPAAFLAAGALAAVPLLLAPLPGGVEPLLAGKEGVLEAITAGLLLALAVHAVRHRDPWVFVGAALLLLEEVDYGQEWRLDARALDAGAALGEGQLRSHHLPVVEALWRLVPLTAVSLLALRARWPRWLAPLASRVRLPRVLPGFLLGLLPLSVGAVATWALAGEGRADEAAELAVVTLVLLAWQPGQR